MATESASLSFLDSLVEPKAGILEYFPATDLIKTLIRAIAYDVSTFKQNNQASYAFVTRTRDIRDEINTLIKSVDENETWTDYELFVNAIDPLERLLLDFSLLVQDYAQSDLLSDSTASVEDYQKAIDDWLKQRDLIKDSFPKLYTAPAFNDIPALTKPETEYSTTLTELTKHDDSTLMSALCVKIKDHPCSVEDGYSQGAVECINQIETLADNIETALGNKYDNEAAILSIKCVALLHTAASLCKAEPDDRYLKSDIIWGPAQTLLTDLQSHFDEPKQEGVETKWSKLVELLSTRKEPELPAVGITFEELRKLVANSKRPYFLQAYTLIQQFRHILEHLKGGEYDQQLLQPAFEGARTALHAARDALFDFANINEYDETTIETDTAGVAFATAQKDVESCFTQYQMDDWDVQAKKFADAVQADKDRMKEVKGWCQKRTLPKVEDLVAVTVKRVGEAEAVQNTYKVYKKTVLSALLFQELSKVGDEERLRLLRTSRFHSDSNAEAATRLTLDTEVGKLLGDGQAEITLYLATAA